jgi:archaellum component FlaD/FlaE
VDAASRAASIRAAREAFQEKEAAKERKHDMEIYKQAEKQYKKTEHRQRKAEEVQEKKRARSISDTNEKTSRPSIGGRQYSDHRHAHSSTLPKPVPTVHYEKRGAGGPKVTKSREAKGWWLRFVTWLKTRMLRMSRRIGTS